MDAKHKEVALRALDISDEDFDQLMADIRAEFPDETVTEEQVLVELHVVNAAELMAQQAGLPIETILENVPMEGGVGLGITVNEDGTFDIELDFQGGERDVD